MGRTLSLSLCLVFLFSARELESQESGTAPGIRSSYATLQLDNDIFTGSDNDYTNGARFAYLHPIRETSLNNAQRILQLMSGADNHPLFVWFTPFADLDSILYDWGSGLTQTMFTPENPEDLASPPGQRPYAGWLGVEFSLHAKNAKALSSVTFSIGVTGKASLARETQDWVHENISDSPLFQGWDSQIPSELTVNVNLDRKRRIELLNEQVDRLLPEVDGYLEWGAALGNLQTNAYVGLLLRLGYNLPVQYMTPRLQLGSYSHELFVSREKIISGFSVYGFAATRGFAVAHDITLDGPVFSNYETGISSEPLVGELLAGFGVNLGRLTVTFTRTFRSKEFRGQESSHRFGSVLLGLRF